MKPYAAKLHDGKNITIVCEGHVVNGAQNMIAVWPDLWRGNVSLTIREVYPVANGMWAPGSIGYNIPIENADLVLTTARVTYDNYVKAIAAQQRPARAASAELRSAKRSRRKANATA